MAVGSARRVVSLAISVLGFAGLLFTAPAARAVEALDGRLQAHGFVEMQVRGMSEKFGVNHNELDLAQWYNILNVEFELDILPDGWGPIDLMSAFVRVEARYDCIYTHGCAMFPSVNTFGDDSERLPRRLRDAEDPDYSGVIKVGPPINRIQDKKPASLAGTRELTTFGEPRLDPDGVLPPDFNTTPQFYRRNWFYPFGNDSSGDPRCSPDPPFNCPGSPGDPIISEQNPIYHEPIVKRLGFPGFDTFFDLKGGDLIANTFDDPGNYLLGDFLDYKFALKDNRGPSGGAGTTQIIGPWLPENVVHSRAVLYDKANPLRGRLAQSTYTSPAATPDFASPGFRSVPNGNVIRRFYTLSTDLRNEGSAALPTWLQEVLWVGSTPDEGYTDLVDPFPEELESFWAQDPFGYNVAPRDDRIPGSTPTSSPAQKFGGDFNGIIPCEEPKRKRFPLAKEFLQSQLDGTAKALGCIPFTNVRVTGGSGELPLRPAPDASNLFAGFDPMHAQGLYVPSRGLLDYMEDGGDFDKHDFNIDETERTWNRGASQQDNKELKEAYVDMEFLDSRLWLRAGLQNIVWGKTELFRTTDQFNPVDIALSGPLAGLEESRIALWSARLVYSFYNVGPLDDVRFEFAANLDDFEPIDLGACGEPYTINFVCGIPTGLWAHGLLGVGVAGVDRPDSFWDDSKGLEFGGRIEWRWDRFSFALTDFWGYNDVPFGDAIFFYERGVEYALTDTDELVFAEGAGRPLAAGTSGGCTGIWGGSGVDGAAGAGTWATANRDPDSYYSTTSAGLGRDPSCLKPGGTAGGLNQNGFTVARNDAGEIIWVVIDKKGLLKPRTTGAQPTRFVSDKDPSVNGGLGNFYPTGGVAPTYCTGPNDPAYSDDPDFDCEPMQYEVGLNETGFNGELFSEGWSPQNALENHTANQQSFAFVCAATLTIGASLDPTACAFNLFGSPKFLEPGVVDFSLSEVVTCVLAGEIGGGCQAFMSALSGATQGEQPRYESGLVSLNRDANDGTITAQSRQPDSLVIGPGGGPVQQWGKGVISRDTFLNPFNVTSFEELILLQTKFLPGPEDMLTLDSTMTNEQRALLGCGPYFGTRCDTSVKSTVFPFVGFGITYCTILGTGCTEGGGIDFINMEASALMQSFVGIEGTDLHDKVYTDNPEHPEWAQWAAGGENFKGTEWAENGLWLTTSGLPQPGTIEFAGGPACTRYVEELNDTIVLPGCRGVNKILYRPTSSDPDNTPVEFQYDAGYRPDVDGCVIGEFIDTHPVYSYDSKGNDITAEINSFCNQSTHKNGGFYVWPECNDPDPTNCLSDDNPVVDPNLVDWDGKDIVASNARMSRPGAGTLWHPYAGCFRNPADALASLPCSHIPQEDIDDIAGTPLADRLAWDKRGVKSPDDPNPRNFEQAFFIDGGFDEASGTWGFNAQSQIFRSEMAAFSHNFMTFLVQASCNKEDDDFANDDECFDPRRQFAVGKCSYVTPQLCVNVKGFFGAAGVQRNVVRAGGNGKYGRRDFLWHSGGELMLRYQKRNVLGFSMDFGEDFTKSSWGVEFTWISKQNFFDSDNYDSGVSQSGVLNLTVSVDRPTFINFLNQNRTFFINTQWFFQYMTDHKDSYVTNGPVNVLFTVAMFTGYFQDRLNPQLVTVYDFMSGSGGILPSVTYRFTDALSVGIGVNFFFGKTQLADMGVREFAPAGNRAGGIAYKNGVDQAIASFRDKDEIWLKLRWTF